MAKDTKLDTVISETRKEERKKLIPKLTEKADKVIAATKRKANQAIQQAKDAPNVTQVAIGAGTGVLAGMGGFKAQKKLAATAAGQAIDPETGEATLGAKIIRTGGPTILGAGVAIGGAFIPIGWLSAAVMGAGTGFAGGVITSAFMDDPA